MNVGRLLPGKAKVSYNGSKTVNRSGRVCQKRSFAKRKEDYFLVQQFQLARFDGKRWMLFGAGSATSSRGTGAR